MRFVTSIGVSVLAAITGCVLEAPSPQPLVVVASIPATPNPALDVLFVIDDSGSMGEEQRGLAEQANALVAQLATGAGGLPDLHVGVVSTNVGSGGVPIGGCSTPTRPDGDGGLLRTSECPGLHAAFLASQPRADGGRDQNFDGELATNLSCMVQLGTSGCGFEQPLEAMRRALAPGVNPGFLRPDAALAVVIISDEDDCSALGTELFAEANGGVDSPLGPRTSFRCFDFGVQCDHDADPRALGTRAGCVPRAASALVRDVTPFVDALRAHKANPRDVVVATITGDVDAARTATVIEDPQFEPGSPTLAPSCQSSHGVAMPALRLRSFAEQFEIHFTSSICAPTMADAMAGTTDAVRTALGSPCLDATLIDSDATRPGTQPRCEVTEYVRRGATLVEPVAVGDCATSGGLCWGLVADPRACPRSPGNQAVRVERSIAPRPGAEVVVRCAVAP